MKLGFHSAVQQDFIQARDYYQTKGGAHLADRFEREFQACLSYQTQAFSLSNHLQGKGRCC
jgi:hypothetical protein